MKQLEFDFRTKEEKFQDLKGVIFCKAKKCNKPLYGNQSSSDPKYCADCF